MIESFKLPVITPETLTGSIVSFTDEYGGLPLKSCTSLISGYQEGSGTASPQNERPLHAFSSGTLTANSNTYTFTFGQSIYQGSIDWLRGIVRVDYIVKTIDENSGCIMTNGVVFLDNFFEITPDSDSIECNLYQRGTNRGSTSTVMSSNPDYSFCCKAGANSDRIMIKDTRFTTIEDYNTWLTNNPVKIAVKLATPIEIPLEGINLLTQEVQNNIFCDTGDTEVKFLKVN